MARNFAFLGSLVKRVRLSRRRLGVICAVGLLICGAAGAWFNHHRKQNARLWVVNGLPKDMLLKFDDERELFVSEQSFRSITLPEGQHRVVVNEPQLSVPAEEFELRNEWWERFLFWRPPMHVLAPGRTAVIAIERDRQEEPGHAVKTESRELTVGRFFATYRDVDLPFQDFPVRAAGDTQSGSLQKTLLYVNREHPRLVVNSRSADMQLQPQDILSFAEAQLVAAPAEIGLLYDYVQLSLKMKEAERCLGFVEKRLSRRPLWHDWHRCYQNACDQLGRRDEVIRKYDALVEEESHTGSPSYSGLLYLRGRLEQDDDRLLSYMQRAVEAHPGNYFAWYSQGVVRLAQGKLREAQPGFRAAYQLQRFHPHYRDDFFEVAIALGEEQLVRRHVEGEIIESHSADLNQQRMLLTALISSNQLDALSAAQNRFSQITNAARPGDPLKLVLQSQLHLMYLQAQFEKILEQSGSLEDPRMRHQALFELGRLKELPQEPILLAGLLPQSAASQHLLLSVAWSQLKDSERAAKEMSAAIQVLSQGTSEERAMAISLQHPDQVTLSEVQGITIFPAQKALALIAMVQRGAVPRKDLLELATKLNYSRRFPYHFVKRTLGFLLAEAADKRT